MLKILVMVEEKRRALEEKRPIKQVMKVHRIYSEHALRYMWPSL